MLEMLRQNGIGRNSRSSYHHRPEKNVCFCDCYQESHDESVLLTRHSSSSSNSLCSHHTTTHLVDDFKRCLSAAERKAYWWSEPELRAIRMEREEETFLEMIQQREKLRKNRNAFHVIDSLSIQYNQNPHSFQTNTLKHHMTKLEKVTHDNTIKNTTTKRSSHQLCQRSPRSSAHKVLNYLDCCMGGDKKLPGNNIKKPAKVVEVAVYKRHAFI